MFTYVIARNVIRCAAEVSQSANVLFSLFKNYCWMVQKTLKSGPSKYHWHFVRMLCQPGNETVVYLSETIIGQWHNRLDWEEGDS